MTDLEQLKSSEYECAFNSFFRQVLEHEEGRDPILSRIRKRTSKHSGVIAYFFDSNWTITPNTFLTQTSIEAQKLREADFSEYILMLKALGEKLRFQKGIVFMQFIQVGTSKSGRALPGNPSLTWETFLLALENLDFNFNEQGEPEFELIASAGDKLSLSISPKPPDFEQRLVKILQQKRKNNDAEKRTRRLSQ